MSPRKGLTAIAAGRLRKLRRKRLSTTWRAATDRRSVIVKWWPALPNWGDALAPVLARLLSGREPLGFHEVVNVRNRPVYGVIGSLLDGSAVFNLEVWGCGFKHPTTSCWIAPRRVHAVRGPLTLGRLREQGIACSDVVGDPALLLPRLYEPDPHARRPLGVVAHYLDRDLPVIRELAERDDVRVIDVFSDTWDFLDQLLACDVVASSSLHGLIAAEAYGIPTVWLELSNRLKGGRFKFHDHYEAVGRTDPEPLRVGPGVAPSDIAEARWEPSLDIDLDRLLAACPFRADGAVPNP